MSEKPFWEGKTCKELKGLRVKVTWADGDTMTSTINVFGNLRHCTSLSPATHPAAPFKPYTEVLSIELLDDPEYERIDNIEDVREGDEVFTLSGNKYQARSVYESREVYVDGDGFSHIIQRKYFAYALRRKPKLPDHDGLWWDKDNALWSVAISGMDDSKLVALLIGDPESPVTGPVWSGLNSKHVTTQAPFRPAKVVEA
ncbi:hypothetical protein [Bifidobacterium breve]|uniref:hypothetical protein n=1 Tax=Bifidobacterium breve TaxID=1685 RepID=UPI000F5FFCA5|nr:hypothetical protein [Bifidobacterium breve]AZI16350.1 hypothetical protein EH245_03410 [Bifidobacterium breve]